MALLESTGAPSSAYGVTPGKAETGVTCWRCSRVLAWVVTPPYVLGCPRCKETTRKGVSEADARRAVSAVRSRARQDRQAIARPQAELDG